MSIERIDGVQPQVTEQIHNKKRSVTNSTPEIPHIDERAASSAIANNARSLVHEFKPAETPEKLLEQIGKIDWFSNEKVAIEDLSSLDKQGCKTLSTFLHKAEGLSPEFKNRINIADMLEKYNDCSNYYDVSSAVKELNISKLNKLKPELAETIGGLWSNQLYSLFFTNKQVQEPELLNELHSLIPQDSQNSEYVFENVNFINKDKETTQKYIDRIRMTQNLDRRIVQKLDISTLLETELSEVKLQKMFDYLNNLPEDKKGTFCESGYMSNLLKFDYSYSVDADPKTIKLGTPEHVPAQNKSQLINELITLRYPDGFFMFRNEDIDAIVNNENSVTELSDILNKLKTRNIKLSKDRLNNLLTTEGLTAKLLEPNFNLIDNIQTNPEYASLKEIFTNDSNAYDIIFSSDIKLSQVEKNIELFDVIKEKAPTTYKPLSDTKTGYNKSFYNTLGFLNNSKIDKKTLEQLLDSNIFETVEPYILNNICESGTLTENNIKLVKDLKSNPKLSFIFKGSYSPEKTIQEILKKDIPEGFEISKKQEIADFLAELHSNPKSSEIINKFSNDKYIDILLKNSDENIDVGRNLIDKIVANDLTGHGAADVLSNHSFSDSLNILTRVEQNPVLKGQMGDFMFFLSKNKDTNFANQVTDVLEYVSKSDSLKDIKLNPQIFSNINKDMQENGLGNLDISLDKLKSKLTELESLKTELNPEIWDNLKSNTLESIIRGKSPIQEFKPENIEYLNKLVASSEFKDSGLTVQELGVNNFLKGNSDLKTLTKNQKEALKLIKDKPVYFSKEELLTFEGDITELRKHIDKIKKENPNDWITLELNKHTKQISIKLDNNVSTSTQVFDNSMKPLYGVTENFSTDKSGRILTEEIHTDKINNVKHKIVKLEDAVYGENVPKEIISTYYDENGKVLKTKIYSESAVDGAFNIKELTPDGKIKTISAVSKNSDGMFVRKNLESLDGTSSNIFYHEGVNGAEDYSYQIVDKDGSELLNHHRTTKKIDPNHSITTVNGKEYHIKYADDFIEVFDSASKTTTKLDLKKLNPGNKEVLNDMLRSLPGDELLNVEKYVNELELTNRIESGMHPILKKMRIGPHRFIFEHELGHAKDHYVTLVEGILNPDNLQNFESRIADSKDLQAIFYDELTSLKGKTSECIQDFVSYFAKGEGEHYGGKLGGLKETIAETNAIQVSGKFHPLLFMRTQILQEYFPKTIAFLVKHKL